MISDRLEDDKRSAGLAGEPLSSFDPAGCAASCAASRRLCGSRPAR